MTAQIASRIRRRGLAGRFARVVLAACAALAAFAGEAGSAAAEPGHAGYVSRALTAVRALGPAGRDDLDRALYDTARSQCHADAAPPSAACLIDAGRAACARAADRASCEVAADVVAANLRGQNALVDEATRIRLVRGSADYRAALAAELRRRYAVLAAELVLAGPGAAPGATPGAGDEAQAIDELCQRRDRALHACQAGDAACVPSLPWSRCVAALVWFVAGASP